jgi:predicted dehydrogenase
MDSGHHLVYMSLFFKGMPLRLQAFKSNLVLSGMEGEDIAQINLLYPDGSIGNIMQSWTSNWGDGINGVKIIGDKGSILITDALYYNSEKLSTDVEYGDSFSNQAKAFTDSILYGKKPLSTLKDVENALKIIYGAYESSEDSSVKIFQE